MYEVELAAQPRHEDPRLLETQIFYRLAQVR